jgi:hypothetical protein
VVLLQQHLDFVMLLRRQLQRRGEAIEFAFDRVRAMAALQPLSQFARRCRCLLSEYAIRRA